MKNNNVKSIGGGFFPVEIEIEISDIITCPSEDDLDNIKKNIEQINYLKKQKGVGVNEAFKKID